MNCIDEKEKVVEEFNKELWQFLDKWEDREDLEINGLLYILISSAKKLACANYDNYFYVNGIINSMVHDRFEELFDNIHKEDEEEHEDATNHL